MAHRRGPGRGQHPRRGRRGFTLIELLVVITIILLVSAVALPSIISAFSHRQVSEAARILQGALVGARDSAIKNNSPSGIRLLPDPTLNGVNPATGTVQPNMPLAMNRIVPLDSAPDYSEGKVSVIKDVTGYSPFTNAPGTMWNFPYPYPSLPNPFGTGTVNVLMVEECPIDPSTFILNEPTSWYWNIRVGDKIRIGDAGQFYTVIGPMTQQNPELFVNVGPPGSTANLLSRAYVNPQNAGPFPVEYLFVVNGLDDDNNGFVDNEWDGVDNDQNGVIDDFPEWTEAEQWAGVLSGFMKPQWTGVLLGSTIILPNGTPPTSGVLNQPYTITRRPVLSSGARETALPTNVVIDATTWAAPPGVTQTVFPPYVQERSRFPIPALGFGSTSQVVNPYSGTIDIMVNPDGSVVPTTIYSSPTSFGLNGAFLHFWLAERSDVTGPVLNANGVPVPGTFSYLPLPAGLAPTNLPTGAELKGEYSLLTVYSRTGQILVSTPPRFDNPMLPANGIKYNANLPFIEAQQGVRGGTQ
ncbi:MAG: pilus assembly FimT family protein [Isosphaeraceae bacterium]